MFGRISSGIVVPVTAIVNGPTPSLILTLNSPVSPLQSG